MAIKASDLLASMGITVIHCDENGMHKVEPKYTEEEAVKKLYEDEYK